MPAFDDPMPRTRGMHHISATASDLARTDAFVQGLLGLSLINRTGNFDDPTMPHWTWGSAEARPGSLITDFGLTSPTAQRAVVGAGQTHHDAFAVPDDEAQGLLRDRLRSAVVPVSTVQDREYLRAMYTRDAHGHFVEVPTASPGLLVDESAHGAGRSLRLPPWLKPQRADIAHALASIDAPVWPHEGIDALASHARPARDLPALDEATV